LPVVAETPTAPRRRSRKRRIAIVVGVSLAVAAVYGGTLLGYHLLASTERPLGPPDLGTTSDTVVVVNLEGLHTVEDRLDVQVLVVPEDSLMDMRLDVVNTDISVRLYPPNELGDLQYPTGKPTTAQFKTTIAANGSPDRWPFDSYTTDVLSADVLVGSGADRQYLPARVEVTGSVEGWDISSTRSGPSTQSSGAGDNVTITLRRAKGPLFFDLGICLVLVSLPAMALFVAIQMLRGRKQFMPPFSTWFAAMLFAVVPIRNFLPGNPPAGAWIDQALVLWVLIALVVSMVLYIVAWQRHSQ
jgi:Domain of unknown function (DUF4436)